MKTSFDLPESLMREVRRTAKEQNTTTKSLVTEALVALLERYSDDQSAYRLPDASVGGEGIAPEFANASWAELREAAYGSRG